MKRWVSVTECLSILRRFEGIHPRVLAQAMQEGTLVHRIFLGWLKGLYFPTPKILIPSVDGLKRWFDMAVEEVLDVETEVKDEVLCLVGHIDFIPRLKGERLFSITDLKRSTVDWTTGLQTAAYEEMAKKKYRRKFGTRYALQIGKDGIRA